MIEHSPQGWKIWKFQEFVFFGRICLALVSSGVWDLQDQKVGEHGAVTHGRSMERKNGRGRLARKFSRSKCLLYEPDDLGSIPGTCIKVEGDSNLAKLSYGGHVCGSQGSVRAETGYYDVQSCLPTGPLQVMLGLSCLLCCCVVISSENALWGREYHKISATDTFKFGRQSQACLPLISRNRFTCSAYYTPAKLLSNPATLKEENKDTI